MSLNPVLPVPLILFLAGVSVIAVVYRSIRGRQPVSRWWHLPVLLLRFASIGCLVVLLWNPSQRVRTPVPEARNLILLDRSASMGLGPTGGATRLEEALTWTEASLAAIDDAGLAAPDLHFFSDETVRAPDTPEARAATKPTGDSTLLAAAIRKVCAPGVGRPPGQLIVVGDGRLHDRDALADALETAASAGAVISTHLVGSDTPPRNAWIANSRAPRIVRPRGIATVHAAVASSGLRKGESLRLELRAEDDRLLDSASIKPDGAATQERLLTFATGLRTASYSLRIVPLAGEVSIEDNRLDFTVEVASSKLRVLFVEGTHVKRSIGGGGHWWNDMELMTRLWDASGEIEYLCLTPISEYNNSPNLVGVTFQNGEMRQDASKTFPRTREELYRYDVMLISDVPVGNFTDEQMQWVVDWVNERGGGFLMGGGYTTFDVGNYDQTPWEKIIPVDMLAYGDGFMEQGFKIAIPESVRGHPIWRISEDPAENKKILDAHPRFLGMNRVRRAKPGALVLATRPDAKDEPIFAAQSYGRGRSIAFLPDPNGGWAREYVGWGPKGGPKIGRHTEIGQGENFVFDEAAAVVPETPQPPHPSPWYGRFWMNTINWLGENSVRWRRDQLAGRAVAASATAGGDLPVAVEVLAVTAPEDMFGLDVGVRLDAPGSPRVRLDYDRDRREFTGQIPVPEDVSGGELTVLFDTHAGGKALTDAIQVGIRRGNREFIDSAPDAAFMTELARAGGGQSLTTSRDLVQLLKESQADREGRSETPVIAPLWPRPWIWALIAGLLAMEWLLRRRGFTARAASSTGSS